MSCGIDGVVVVEIVSDFTVNSFNGRFLFALNLRAVASDNFRNDFCLDFSVSKCCRNQSLHDKFSKREPFSSESLTLEHTRHALERSSSEASVENGEKVLLPLIFNTSGAM